LTSDKGVHTIALRFSDNFAPPEGTIAAHEKMISENGYVWYGKLGSTLSDRTIKYVLCESNPRILLIHSGKGARYWAYIDRIQREEPSRVEIPQYYRDRSSSFKCWFRVINIHQAAGDVMSKCIVASSGAVLSMASRHSMSPYFIIEYYESYSKEGDEI